MRMSERLAEEYGSRYADEFIKEAAKRISIVRSITSRLLPWLHVLLLGLNR